MIRYYFLFINFMFFRSFFIFSQYRLTPIFSRNLIIIKIIIIFCLIFPDLYSFRKRKFLKIIYTLIYDLFFFKVNIGDVKTTIQLSKLWVSIEIPKIQSKEYMVLIPKIFIMKINVIVHFLTRVERLYWRNESLWHEPKANAVTSFDN